jgi:folate-binding protein YgfZ
VILDTYAAAHEKLAHRFRPTGILDVTGGDRESFLQGQLTQDVRGLAPGESRAAAGLTPKGKLLFVARVLGLEDRMRVVVPEILRSLVLEHLRKYAVFTKVAIEDRTPDFVQVGVSGPEGRRLALPDWVDRLAPERGFSAELLVAAQRREELETLLRALGSSGISDVSAEVLRVEAGRPRFGTDMDSTNLPDEVGMDDAISTTKGCYVGQEVVARLRTYGRVNRRLVSFRFPEGSIAAGDLLRLPDQEKPSKVEAGRVTSSVHSPRFGAIGLGYAFRDVALGARLVSDKNPALTAVVETLDSRIAG